MNSVILNLRDEWNIYRKKNKKTQAQASLELGWSPSLFNQFLCGRRPLNYDHIIKIANYFDISPTSIHPEFNFPRWASIDVSATSSGNPPPSKKKTYLTHAKERFLIWCDTAVEIEYGPDYQETTSLSGGNPPLNANPSQIQAGASLMCCVPEESTAANDVYFPVPSVLWIINQKRAMRAMLNPVKPRIRAESIYRVMAILLT